MNNQIEPRKEVNRDVLNLICQENGKTIFKQVDIQESTEKLAKLKAMIDNGNQTVLDMQSEFNIAFDPMSSYRYFKYMTPFRYNDSYITGPVYPEVITWQEYQEQRDAKEIELKSEYRDKYGNSGVGVTEQEFVKKHLADHEKGLKESFWQIAERYIHAYDYSNSVSSARVNQEVRMYSTEAIGWSQFDYKITDDVSVVIRTNFGYGLSSYFNLTLYYKGIEIAPYSYVVRYYGVNWMNVIRQTRAYYPRRDSWNLSFRFVEGAANRASTNQAEFEKTFIVNEIAEMVAGLRLILNNTARYIDSKKDDDGESAYISVWNMTGDDKRKYGLYPSEVCLATQAEKITGALVFLDNLKSLSSIFTEIEESISEIKEMAASVLPSINNGIKNINEQLVPQRVKLTSLQFEYNACVSAISAHVKRIDELCSSLGDKTRYEVEVKYEKDYPEYAELLKKKSELSDEIYNLRREISDRESFLQILDESLQRVTSAGLTGEQVA